MKQQTVQEMGAWIGLYRKADNKFYWIDDTPLAGQYSAWMSGEPNNAKLDENCVHTYNHMKNKVPGKWNDEECNFSKASHYRSAPVVLCQKKFI